MGLGWQGDLSMNERKETPKLKPKSKTTNRIKATFYLYPEDILAIDYMQSEEFRKTGRKPKRSEIVSRAIQLLRQHTKGSEGTSIPR